MNIYFGKNLKELRLKKNLTQEKLADILGVSFQTVSKWERGDTYPDITFLPDIADFFNISVDDILGTNRAKNENEITAFCRYYDNLTDNKQRKSAIEEAVKNHPADFRILLRYMSYLIHFEGNTTKIMPKVRTIYDNIQQNCTDDSIRICAKRHIVQYYRNMAHDKNSGITFNEVEEILSQMPYMRDGRDFISAYVYPLDHPEHYNICKESIEEEIGLICCTLTHCFLWDDDFDADYNINIAKKINSIINLFYNKDNYGIQWRIIIKNYMDIGFFYYRKGDNKNAYRYLKYSAESAKKFDLLDKISTLNSLLLNGIEFDKSTLGSNFVASSSVKEKLTDGYPFSEYFKSTDAFKNIINMLE